MLDQSVSRALATYGGHQVKTLDPCAIYEQEGSTGLEAAIESAVYKDKVDVFICCAFGMWMELNPEFVYDRLRDCYRVYIVGDDEGHFDLFDRYNGQAYDLVMSANPLVERYQQYLIDAEYYPSVYPAAAFCPSEENRTKCHDVSFIGAVKDKMGREEGISTLERAGIGVVVFGFGTTNGPIAADGALSVYRQSRINLNFTGSGRSPLSSNQVIMDRVRQVKGRCTKIALCGSFVLSEYAPGIDRLFEIGWEIDVFRDSQELVEKVRYYLDHEDIREEMATRAYSRAIKQYDEAIYWAQVSTRLQDRAQARKAKNRGRLPLLIDKPFWGVYGACRFKYLVIFLFSGRLDLAFQEMRMLFRVGRVNPRAAIWFAGTGLHIARQRSRVAAVIAAGARGLRKLLTR